jgi:hypothetical protein
MAADCECSSSTLCNQDENRGNECWAAGGETNAEDEAEDDGAEEKGGDDGAVDESTNRCSIPSTFAGSVASSKAREW